ncbi:MAG: response regulator transcription factor [Gammaproteobacteria bacterium]|nr:response regulator transcription factor [Gammaproteobacteria bacterium]
MISQHGQSKQILVGVADKSPLMRAALKQIFTEDDRFQIVSQDENSRDFLNTLEKVHMDVVVSGWIIPPGDARFILARLKSRKPAPRVVVYTGFESETVPVQVMAHGGAAFVSKNEQPEYLLDTIAQVARGRMVFPYLDVSRLNANPLTTLTRRELEVLASLAAGHTNKQIAAEKGVSTNTVKYHIRNLFDKLGVNNRGQAIALYLKS